MKPTDIHSLPALWPPDYETDSSSVHSPETKPPNSTKRTDWGSVVTSNDPSVAFRHSGWARSRRKIREALAAEWMSPRRLQRFDLCGTEPWVAVDEHDPENLTILTNHCKSRWCVPCSRERAARICGNLRPKLEEGPIRFLTLTMKHTDTPLRAQIDRIYHCFRRLRRAKFWLRAVTGGAAVLEITHGWRDDLWHVHLHCLLQGSFIAHADLKAEWWRITGDSNILDIRFVRDTATAARYVTKYVTKPISRTVIEKPEPLAELISACSRRRLVLTWGSWRGLKLSSPLTTVTWKSLCPLEELYLRRDAGDSNATTLLAHLERIIPGVGALAGRGPPLEPPHAIA